MLWLEIFSFTIFYFFQLDNSDEQAAAIRRELDARQEEINKMERVRKMPKLLNIYNINVHISMLTLDVKKILK